MIFDIDKNFFENTLNKEQFTELKHAVFQYIDAIKVTNRKNYKLLCKILYSFHFLNLEGEPYIRKLSNNKIIHNLKLGSSSITTSYARYIYIHSGRKYRRIKSLEDKIISVEELQNKIIVEYKQLKKQ